MTHCIAKSLIWMRTKNSSLLRTIHTTNGVQQKKQYTIGGLLKTLCYKKKSFNLFLVKLTNIYEGGY